MEIAVVGTPEFTLGFQLAGISHLHNPVDDEAMASVLRTLLNSKEVGIVVVDSTSLSRLPERLREQLSASVTPTVLGIGTEEDNTLRDTIRKAIGVDLWA
ncbi:MAG: V-type ATP synthase subunit F [Candidatus Poseidoniales archaeon]|jgi:V/A-type H+-transporting ATPase subunit F|nr:MAG: V-type ATP synthase subunit F [Candidatus Poseidoniales archaeon]